MSFKVNLKAKISLDRLLRKLVPTIREPPRKRWVDKALTWKLLGMTDFAYKKVGNLDLSIYGRWGAMTPPWSSRSLSNKARSGIVGTAVWSNEFVICVVHEGTASKWFTVPETAIHSREN